MILEKRIKKELNRHFEKENLSISERRYLLEELKLLGERIKDEDFIELLPKTNPLYKVLSKALGLSDRTKQTLNKTINSVQNKMANIDFKRALSEAFLNRNYNRTAIAFFDSLKACTLLGSATFKTVNESFYGTLGYRNGKLIRLNFHDSGAISIDSWKNPKLDENGNFNTPDKRLLIEDNDFRPYLSSIQDFIQATTLVESKKYVPNSEKLEIKTCEQEQIGLCNENTLSANIFDYLVENLDNISLLGNPTIDIRNKALNLLRENKNLSVRLFETVCILLTESLKFNTEQDSFKIINQLIN